MFYCSGTSKYYGSIADALSDSTARNRSPGRIWLVASNGKKLLQISVGTPEDHPTLRPQLSKDEASKAWKEWKAPQQKWKKGGAPKQQRKPKPVREPGTLFFCDATNTYHKAKGKAKHAGLHSGKPWQVFQCNPNEDRIFVCGGQPKAKQFRHKKQKANPPSILEQLGFTCYADYLKSPLWASIRFRRLALDRHLCQCCFRPASQVHHLRYTKEVFLGENLDGLRSICRPCHEEISLFPRKPVLRGDRHKRKQRPLSQANDLFYTLRKQHGRTQAVAAKT